MRNRILYWDGIIDLKGLTSDYHKIIQMLLAGEYRLLSLEKLRGHDVYSVRINDTHRMLFKTEVIDGRSMLVILDIVLNHDYHKSPFLKPAVLRNYLELNGQAILDVVNQNDFDNIDEPNVVCQSTNAEEYEFAPAEYYKQRFIEFNDVQRQIVHVAKLPLVINGAAGSGKSCVALSLLSHYVLNNLQHETKPILYVTQSENLCNNMLKNWQSLPIAHHQNASLVEFKTYKQLISENFADGFKPKPVGSEEFRMYMQNRLKTKAVRNITSSLNQEFINQIEVMYQELRIICGCRDLEHYNRLGKNQSLLKDKRERAWLFNEYQVYLNHLKHNNLIDFAFYDSQVKGIFDLIVVDETQDLSNLQIATLYAMAVNRQVCFCEDMRQSLTDKLPKIYAHILNAEERDVTFIQLKQTYRCPPAVLRMANGVAQLANRLVKQHFVPTVNGIADKEGSVIWHDVLTKEESQAYKVHAQTPEFAVVTRRECVAEAKALFETELVYTVDEIKGLEYRNVLVYRLLNEVIYFEISNLIAEEVVARPGNEKYCPALNAFYTACTRSTESLIIVEDQPDICHKLQHLIKYLKQGLPLVALVPKPIRKHTEAETQQMWFREAKRLMEIGDKKRAQDIYLNRLGATKDVFERDYANYNPKQNQATNEGVKLISVQPASSKNNKKRPPKQTYLIDGDEVKFVADLLANPSKAKLEVLFDSKKAIQLLFDYNEDNETLFTSLFDIDEIREIILEQGVLAKSYNKLALGFNERTINRAKPFNLDGSKMPPIFWMVTHEKTLSALSRNPLFKIMLMKLVSPETLLAQYINQGHPLHGICILYELSCSTWGIAALCDYYNSHSEALVSITARLLFTYFKRTCLFQNLISDDNGHDLFEKLVAINPRYLQHIGILDLLRMDISKPQVILSSILSRPKGRQFIKALQSKNTAFYDRDVSQLNKQQVKELVLECIGTEEERVYLNNVILQLKDASLEELETIFTNKNAVKFLFKMYLFDHESLFAKLFEYPQPRRWMLTTIIPAYMAIISPNMRPRILARISTKHHMPPMFWLAGCESGGLMLARWMMLPTCGTEMPVSALLKTMSVSDYLRYASVPDEYNPFQNKSYIPTINKDNEISTFQLLLLLKTGRKILLYLESRIKIFALLPEDILTRKWITEVASKKVISSLLYLAKIENGCYLLTAILFLHADKKLITTDNLLDGLIIDSNHTLSGECALLHLLNIGDDGEFLLSLLQKSEYFDMERILPIVLYALMPNCNIITDGEWIIKIFKHEEYNSHLLKIFQRQPHLIKMLNKQIFLGDMGQLPFYKQFVIDALNESPSGIALLKMIQEGLREPYSPRLFAVQEEVVADPVIASAARQSSL